jgi:4-amino-4-deoxy-L-arabinose transferase-like glycosyltransferase
LSNNANAWFIIIFSLLCLITSVRYYYKDNFNLALFFIIICGLALRVFISSDPFLHDWDEKYHALVAKNLMVNPSKPTLYLNPILPYDFTNWTSNHIWLHKQPMPLWLISLSLKTFGISNFAVRIPSILLSTICIWLTFFIASELINKKVAVIAAFLFSINGLVLELTGGRVATDHIDVVFLFFTELSVVFSILFSKNAKHLFNILTGVCIGAAILTKWLPALIILPLWLLLLFDSKKFTLKAIAQNFLILLFTTIIVCVPWQIYIHTAFPKEAFWETSFNLKHFTEVIENQSGSYLYFINKIRINYGELIYLSLIWFLIVCFKNPYRLKLLVLLVWFIVPIVFFSIAKTKMQAYILFVCPALFIITADFCQYLIQLENTKFKWVFNFIVILILITPIRYCIERLKPFKNEDSKISITASILKLKSSNFTSKDVLLNCNYPIEMMFYTNLTSYKGLPEINVIEDLIKKGYHVHINNHEKIPDEVNKINGAKLIDLGF